MARGSNLHRQNKGSVTEIEKNAIKHVNRRKTFSYHYFNALQVNTIQLATYHAIQLVSQSLLLASRSLLNPQ
jgi:hypothetical protein